eukprot:TRINITY_DN4939_c0_g1_i2.p1 TRINITY_DN4939_c0_g1~~TRINITY_DN4939_c0_g1_i2.p1  ORF type:complete len:601 (-),score=95.02 TRINITY_DN4939_c0_g1_i2:847-2649(-)
MSSQEPNNNHSETGSSATVHEIRDEKVGYGMYYFLRFLTRIVMSIFFRKVEVIGAANIPATGGVIIAGNHFNQFVDGMLLMTVCPRPVCFIAAEKSMKRPFIGWFGRKIKALPVVRPQDHAVNGAGLISVDGCQVQGKDTKFMRQCEVGGSIMIQQCESPLRIKEIVSDTQLLLSEPYPDLHADISYKCLMKIDQSKVYETVWRSLHRGTCIGLFPEGGSHDRTELLPLKAGIAVMSLGYVDKYKEESVIVPCGFTYFDGDRFRGQVVIEFGTPIRIPPEAELSQKYKTDRRSAFSELLRITKENIEAVAVTAPTYADLCAFHLARKLYQVTTGQEMKPSQRAELVKKMSYLYRTTTTGSEDIKLLKQRLLEFQEKLESLGIEQEQLNQFSTSYWKAFPILIFRLISIVTLFALSLPGILVNLPAGIVCQHLAAKEMRQAKANSNVKIEGKDVVASYKLIVGFLIIPFLYITYTGASIVLVALFLEGDLRWIWPVIVFFGLPFFSYASIKVTEQWLIMLKSIHPLLFMLNPFTRSHRQELLQLQQNLFRDVNMFVGRARNSQIYTPAVTVRGLPSKVSPMIHEAEENDNVQVIIARGPPT